MAFTGKFKHKAEPQPSGDGQPVHFFAKKGQRELNPFLVSVGKACFNAKIIQIRRAQIYGEKSDVCCKLLNELICFISSASWGSAIYNQWLQSKPRAVQNGSIIPRGSLRSPQTPTVYPLVQMKMQSLSGEAKKLAFNDVKSFASSVQQRWHSQI